MSISRWIVVVPVLAGLTITGSAMARMLPAETVRDTVYQTCQHNGVHFNKQGHANCGLHRGWSNDPTTEPGSEPGTEPGGDTGGEPVDAPTTDSGSGGHHGHGPKHTAGPRHGKSGHGSGNGHGGGSSTHSHGGGNGHAGGNGHSKKS